MSPVRLRCVSDASHIRLFRPRITQSHGWAETSQFLSEVSRLTSIPCKIRGRLVVTRRRECRCGAARNPSTSRISSEASAKREIYERATLKTPSRRRHGGRALLARWRGWRCHMQARLRPSDGPGRFSNATTPHECLSSGKRGPRLQPGCGRASSVYHGRAQRVQRWKIPPQTIYSQNARGLKELLAG